MKKASRPLKAGRQLGESIAETANIFYLLDNRQEYLEGLKEVIDRELEKVKVLRVKFSAGQ